MADFGALDELAPAYQAELTAGQGRRLALILLLLPAGSAAVGISATRLGAVAG